MSDDIIGEYREVLATLRVRRPLIGRVVNLLNEEAELLISKSGTNVRARWAFERFMA